MYGLLLISIGSIIGISCGYLVPPCSGKNEIACADKTKCIPLSAICDYNKDCDDYSDEFNLPLCKALLSQASDGCGQRQITCLEKNDDYEDDSYGTYYKYNHNRNVCKDLKEACLLGPECLEPKNQIICDEIASGTLRSTFEIENLDFEDSDTEMLIAMLKDSVRYTLTNESKPCPVFYKPVNSVCLALFSPIKLPWERAKEFCQDMKGSLATVHEGHEFLELLEFLKMNNVTSKFWLGGSYANACPSQSNSSSDGSLGSVSAPRDELKMIYDILQTRNISSSLLFGRSNLTAVLSNSETPSRASEYQGATGTTCNKWMWLDGEPVKLGSPFWSVVYFSANSNQCFVLRKQQGPLLSRSEGRCLAVLDDNFYLFSDELCTKRFTPLCMADQATFF